MAESEYDRRQRLAEEATRRAEQQAERQRRNVDRMNEDLRAAIQDRRDRTRPLRRGAP